MVPPDFLKETESRNGTEAHEAQVALMVRALPHIARRQAMVWMPYDALESPQKSDAR